ncbi:MAG: ASCH domain-containing protein [Mycoplasmatota bacterium]
MKVITLKQPWATLVAEGIKQYEFRSWKYNYRGKILIHAGAGVDKEKMKKYKHLNLNYPKKKIIAEVDIIDCIKLDEEKSKEINKQNPLIYGNKIRDGYAWKLENIKKVNIGEEISGKQGIWNY